MFPAFLKKMPIAVALRVALSQMPGQNATYLIRRDYIEVTTSDRAITEKVIRVHPVGDLAIPISQSGGMQQFGQSAQFSTVQRPARRFGGPRRRRLGRHSAAVLGALGGGGGFGMNFTPGSSLGGTAGTYNGGGFQGGFNGSLGALGGGSNMTGLIKVITLVVDPGHWYFVQQQNPFQQQNAFSNMNPFGAAAAVLWAAPSVAPSVASAAERALRVAHRLRPARAARPTC